MGLAQDSSRHLTTATVSDDIGLIVAVAFKSEEFSIYMLKPSVKSRVTSTKDISLHST